jgi:hypothetical protein
MFNQPANPRGLFCFLVASIDSLASFEETREKAIEQSRNILKQHSSRVTRSRRRGVPQIVLACGCGVNEKTIFGTATTAQRLHSDIRIVLKLLLLIFA